ncbi:S-type pyocin domain-containing protein [Pseudomonas sp. B707]|uniref:S-type pyocin domain-containing protein n=1 Tax=Pseudomonas sp. B707 TaxID=2689570 RepID=UPI001F1058D7|nr:S-type pyocin domain-containing protein [Pseudomonas sp. B707]MCH4900947.1 HNH nuclease [Pseudomonas sp. B707]
MARRGIELPASIVRPDNQDVYVHYLSLGDGSGPAIDFAPLGEILDMENTYKAFSGSLPQILEVELSQVRAGGDSSSLPPLDTLARELRFRDALIARKFGALIAAKDIAIQRFGHAQVETFFNGGRLPQVNRRGGNVSVRQAYSELFNAKLLVEGIGQLNSQSATVRNVIAAVQVQEANRIAHEQARIAAQNQARLVAEEQARVAAQAAEIARLAAVDEARQKAEEQARREADEHARQLLEDRLRDADRARREAQAFHLQGAAWNPQLVFSTSTGPVSIRESARSRLRAAIRSASAGLSALAAGTVSGLIVGVAALVYSPALGNGELPKRFLVSVPLSDLLSGPVPDLGQLAATGGSLDLPVRVNSRAGEGDHTELLVIPVDGVRFPTGVPVIAAVHNPQDNTYRATTTDIPSETLVWTPSITPADSSTVLPVPEPDPAQYTGGDIVPVEGRIDRHPDLGDFDFNDWILVFPPDSGIPPQYIMFRDPRNDSGIASGYGEPVATGWLEAASQGNGTAIPAQIAEQLRGRQFSDFRTFRESFWKAVGADSELSSQFGNTNRERLMRGHSPFTIPGEQVGGNKVYEIHHLDFIKNGGAVYDMDNLRLLTPKQHVEVHSASGGERNAS